MVQVSLSMSEKNQITLPFYEVLPDLFQTAHEMEIFEDGKAWVDAVPRCSIEEIRSQWNKAKKDKKSIEDFISDYFDLPNADNKTIQYNQSPTVESHIKNLWPSLFRKGSLSHIEGSSLITIPFDYVVPGGRFNEMYYWDSYFTMLGLAIHGHKPMIRNMTKNFAYFIDRFGFAPNGNRSYFLSRSQPPFFGLMVELLAGVEDESVYAEFLPQLLKEHAFWMTPPRVIVFDNGLTLNRYADNKSEPREEMYRDDQKEGAHLADPASFYNHLRSACESGWDFSSRWMRNKDDLTTIHTHDIAPVDLNALLFALEMIIAKSYGQMGEDKLAEKFTSLADARKTAMTQYCWHGFWTDYHHDVQRPYQLITAASITPLFVGLSTADQAALTHDQIVEMLLKPGGLCTTTVQSGQQWDKPNGWAPLQWMAVAGLSRYGFTQTATTIAQRWTMLNEKVFANTGKMLEKYNVENTDLPGGGGEYPVQDGFGWTNGVYLALQSWLKGTYKL